MSVNKVILVGNVGKDPEVRHLDQGVAVANFPLATSESYTSKSGEKITTTEWHNIVAWRGLANLAEKYIVKGRQLFIEGRIRSRSYDDKDGVKRYITEIYADTIQLLGKRDDANGSGNDTKQAVEMQSSMPASAPKEESFPKEEEDDLPF